MNSELEIVITQHIGHPDYPGTATTEYRFTDLEEAQLSFNNLRICDGEFKRTSIKIVEVIQR